MVQKPQGPCAAAQLMCVYDFLSNIGTPMHSSKSRPQGPSTAAESLEFLRPCVSLVSGYKTSLFILPHHCQIHGERWRDVFTSVSPG